MQKLWKSTDGYVIVSLNPESIALLSNKFTKFSDFLQSESENNISQYLFKK